ncbi:MAG: hypothetical protein GXO89_14490 [Chlorobi bacterium]|nr:hypothetical protein [Chlorobiota bacterium]
MKTISVVIILLLNTILGFSQDNSNSGLLSRLGGIHQEGNYFYELEAYGIAVLFFPEAYSEKSLKKIRKKLKISKKTNGFTDTVFGGKNSIFRHQEMGDDSMMLYTANYIIDDKKGSVYGFQFTSVNKRDTLLERRFVKMFLNDEIPESVYAYRQIDSIDFAGRKIALGPACHWMYVHNVQCPDLGQMDWSLHTTLEDAQTASDSKLTMADNLRMGDIRSMEEVDVIFEGVETTAKRIRYKIKIPKIVMGGSNVLIVYYVVVKVRGNYISCVLSHYTDDVKGKNGLSPLLGEVMELK